MFAIGPEGNRLSKIQCIGQAGVPAQDFGGWGYGGVGSWLNLTQSPH